MDVLALTLYGIMLFPNIEDFVGYTATYVFMASRARFENPVTTILVDVYEILNSCYNMKKKRCGVVCLCVWLISRVSEKSCQHQMSC